MVDVIAVDDAERVHGRLGRHRGKTEAKQDPHSLGRARIGAAAQQAPAHRPPEPEEDQGARAVVAQQEAPRALVKANDEHNRGPDGHPDIDQRGDRVGAHSLVHTQDDVALLGLDRIGDRARLRGLDRVGNRLVVDLVHGECADLAAGLRRKPLAVIVFALGRHSPSRQRVAPLRVGVGVVEAQERLDDPEAHENADEDDPVCQQLHDPVARRRDVPRVHRQQQDGDELRYDIGHLVCRQRADKAPQIRRHADGPRALRRVGTARTG